ncbi:hypothetical protein LINGRAHAP2_LOCUS9506 [Linum grandiflorum]
MKTVSGEIASSTPVSLSRAAFILSNFVSADTGASPAVNAYLRRSSSAFDGLLRLHSKSERGKQGKPQSDAAASVTTVDEPAWKMEGRGRRRKG